MPDIAHIDQPVVASLAIAVDNAFRRHMAPDNPLQRSFIGIRDDLGVGPAVALEDAKDNGLGAGTPATLTPDPSRDKVGFIDSDLARKRAATFALLGQSDPNLEVDSVDRACTDAGQLRCCGGAEI